ncbi:aldo/keto reductase [Actinoplanes sp. SE50]|uniref:aldo/keto reductase n=1 Tax=unclassified Actinoplanes TaxID=2626549 RepID=UPI00023EC37A|nr:MULTISPECIES: aldo/keto reductase [unclassified Actinoplanes]AEV87564.1 aldo/keto reductase [Actinoplanes sp. SE50/110]ATO85967.1 aldo/keto reductase [Actinoplanes sp. SE50]SLM03381.1 aldo/keto reductase [Actinoplanes sp. SE50/110]
MELRDFGRLGQISALTLGGGGIGAVWGPTDRREAVATVHAALDAGITMLDVAPSYGADFEAERVAGEAIRSSSHPDVLVTSKVGLPDDTERDFAARIRRSLTDSLRRIGRDHLDVFFLHTQLRTAVPAPGTIGRDGYLEAAGEFLRLRDEGLIRAWGITAVGHPDQVITVLGDTPRPDVAQVVVNALDLNADWYFPGVAPRSDAIVRSANDNGVEVMAIRAVAAGALTSSLDRTVPSASPVASDFAAAEPFRKLAAEWGATPAALAHRYALTVPGVSTVILGVKNRTELAECLAAEAAGPLTPAELTTIQALRP